MVLLLLGSGCRCDEEGLTAEKRNQDLGKYQRRGPEIEVYPHETFVLTTYKRGSPKLHGQEETSIRFGKVSVIYYATVCKNFDLEKRELYPFPWVSSSVFHKCERAFVFSSVDIIILLDDFFLLGRRRNDPGRGTWALPGGIIRRGESREESVYRIVIDETTLDIHNIRILGTYDHIWPTRQYVSSCYIAEVKGKLGNLPSRTREFTKLTFHQSIPADTHENYVIMLKDAGLGLAEAQDESINTNQC